VVGRTTKPLTRHIQTNLQQHQMTNQGHKVLIDDELPIKELLEMKRPQIASKIDEDSLPDLFYSNSSVKHAAESESEEGLFKLSLHALIISLSMNNVNQSELPDDIKNLTIQKIVESDLKNIY